MENRTYEAWRITYQSSEQAARALWDEMRTQIQHLINERNAFGLAIDRALSGIVPDEHPLRSRLVEIAALKARLVEYMQQEPVAWMCPDDPDSATAFSWRPVACELASCLKRRVPLYLAPGAQPTPNEDDILGPEQSSLKADIDAQTNPASAGDPGLF